MDKDILNQYIDACGLIKETEEDIRRLKKRRQVIVQGLVKGSMPEFPYAPKNFHVSGIPYSVICDPDNLEMEEKLLEERKANAEVIKIQVESWLNTIPIRMQRIIRHKVFEQKSWNETAISMGRKATADSVRMEFERFMAEK